MSLLKMKLKAAVLAGIAGVLVFAGGAWAQSVVLSLATTSAPVGSTSPVNVMAEVEGTASTDDLMGLTFNISGTDAAQFDVAGSFTGTIAASTFPTASATGFTIAPKATATAGAKTLTVVAVGTGNTVTTATLTFTLVDGPSVVLSLATTSAPVGSTSPVNVMAAVKGTASTDDLTGLTFDISGADAAQFDVAGSFTGTIAASASPTASATGFTIAPKATATAGAKTLTVVAVGTGNTVTTTTLTFTIGQGGQGTPAAITLSVAKLPADGQVYATNIVGRLTATVSISNRGDTIPDANVVVSWFRFIPGTTVNSGTAPVYGTVAGGAVRNVEKVGEGLVYVLPDGLTAATYNYFALVEATSTGGTVLTKAYDYALLQTIVVSPRPIITITQQPTGFTGGDAKTEGGALGSLTIVAKTGVTLADGSDGTVVPNTNEKTGYQWYWTNKDGVGGGSLSFTNAATLPVPSGLTAGVYYFRCEVRFENALPVKSNVVTVQVKPTVASGKELITGTINVADITTIDYSIPSKRTNSSGGSNNSGTKLRVVYPTSNLVSGMPNHEGWAVTKMVYTKKVPSTSTYFEEYNIVKTGGVAGEDFNHGVEYAGEYDVEVTVEGTVKSSAPDGTKPAIAKKMVRLVVRPKNLSTIAAKDFVVKAPVGDSVYDGRSKMPTVEIKDGTQTLLLGTDYVLRTPWGDPNKYDNNLKAWVNAGVASVVVSGKEEDADEVGGNYTGDRIGTFNIRKMPISVNQAATEVSGKTYDGTDTLPTWISGTNDKTDNNNRSVRVHFVNEGNLPDDLRPDVEYIVSGAKFDSKDVGVRTVNNITVRLDTLNSNGVANNYTFGAVNAAAVITSTFSKASVRISKADPKESFLSVNVPDSVRYNGQGRSIGTVAWKSNVTNPGQTAFEVWYTDVDAGTSPSKTLPKGPEPNKDIKGGYLGTESVTYDVAVKVSGGSNFNDGFIYLEKPFVITAPRNATIETKPSHFVVDASGSSVAKDETDTTVYVGMSLVLKASAKLPDSTSFVVKDADGKPIPSVLDPDVDSVLQIPYKGGTLSYQWYKLPTKDADGEKEGEKWDTLKVRGGTTASYTLPQPLKEGVEYYQVRMIWNYAAVQRPDTSWLAEPLIITIGPEPVSLEDADVTVSGGPYIYDGKRFTISSDAVTVALDGGATTLRLNDDYTLESYGLNAGVGAGTVTITGKNGYKGTAIGYFDIEKIETSEDVLVFGTTKQYNDSIQEFSVAPKTGLTGLGAVTRTYFAKGDDDELTQLTGAPKAVGNYVVKVSIAAGQNFTALEEFERTYSIVKRVLTKADFTYTIPEEHAYTGVAKPAVTATLKSNVKGYTGTQRVVYLFGNEQLTAMPTAEGKYEVAVDVSGDANFANVMVILGIYEIHEEGWVGVKGSDRVVPTKPATEVAAIAPVKVVASGFTAGPSPVRNGEVIKFFSRSNVKSGSLYIFDQSGNSVAKVKASGSGEIGSWKANASAGSYVVKGVLIGKDGTKEKVSFVFAVTK